MNRLEPDPWTLCVTPEHFAEQMDVVRRLTPRAIVTFDDGYADNLYEALPVLERYDVEARFFITTGAIGSETEMWWDAIERLFLEGKGSYDLEADLAAGEPSPYLREFHRLRKLESEEQERALDALFASRGLARCARADRRMLNEQEVAELAASPLAEIGAHTVTHPVLSQLNAARQDEEISNSRRKLEELIDAPVRGFAYPNGTDADYTAETVAIVRRCGFSYAYSAFEHRREDRFQLPRVMIRDWDGETFERVLRGQQNRSR